MAVRTANGGSLTKAPGSRGVSMNTMATVARTAVVATASERAAAKPMTRFARRILRTNDGSGRASRVGRWDRYSHNAPRAAHGTRNTRNPVPSDNAPASAIRIRLDTTENDRSRRRGTSKECRTWTHTNSDASGIRAWSTDCANRTLCRNPPRAASRPTTSTTFVPTLVLSRRKYENVYPAGTRSIAAIHVAVSVAPWAITATRATMTIAATTTRSRMESSGCSFSRVTTRVGTVDADTRPGPRSNGSGTR